MGNNPCAGMAHLWYKTMSSFKLSHKSSISPLTSGVDDFKGLDKLTTKFVGDL